MMGTSRIAVFAAVLSLLLAAAACTPTGGGTDVAQLPEVFVFPMATEVRLISSEDIPLNNCSGGAELSQTVERSHTVLRTLELGTGITVDASGRAGIPGIGEVGVGAAVASHYQVSYGSQDTVARSVTVAAREGTNILHGIRQNEIWETGEVLISVGGVNQRIPFSFRKDFNMETLPPANLGCPGQGAQLPVDTDAEAGQSSRQIEPAEPVVVEPQPTNTSEPPPTAKPPVESCGPATMQGPLAQGTHTFDGPVHVVQLWRQNGQSPWGDSEVMAVVIGQVTILEAGGNVWTYPSDSCRDIAVIHMQDGANSRNSTVVTAQELREAGLIR